MFTSIILLSLFTIISGLNGESANQNLRKQQNAYNLLYMPTKYADSRFFKAPSELMAGRGFGKRNDENTQSNYGMENEEEEQDMLNDYGMADEMVQRSFPFPYIQDLSKLPKFSDTSDSSAPLKNHRLQLRDGKFPFQKGDLRTGRGFGKRFYLED